jgi:CubicO group peptidase (beta-lactamase class C family)
MHNSRRGPAGLLGALLVATALAGCAADLPTPPVTPPEPATVAAALDSIRVAWNLPALGGAIVTRDGVVALEVVGRRRAGAAVPATTGDRFHIGSNFKAVTAGLIGALVDDGLLSWELTLADALPELVPVMTPEYRRVTLADLLAHTSRLPANPIIAADRSQDASAQRLQTTEWGIRQTPGPAGFNYSNVGYVVAGLIAERAAGEPFETLVATRLLATLGVTTLGFGPMASPGTVDQPWQHTFGAGNQLIEVPPSPEADNPSAFGPAGRAHMSLPDWARYVQAVLQAEAGSTSVWSRATAQRLTTSHATLPGGDGYALGWVTTIRNWAPGPILAHSGSNTLNYSVAWVAPQAGFAVLVVTNVGGERAALATDAAAGRLIHRHLTGH